MLGTGVSSFGHFQGHHIQNVDGIEDYNNLVEAGELPLGRALALSPRELMIREFILQLKKGSVQVSYFENKFGLDVREEFKQQLNRHRDDGYMKIGADGEIRLTRTGLLRADSLLEPFFDARHRGARYT